MDIPEELIRKLEQNKGFASQQTLEELRDAMVKTKKVDKDNVDKLGKSAGQGAKDIKVFGTTIGKMNPALEALETGFNILGNAITGASGLVRSIASADGSFESLGGVVDFAAQTIENTFGRLPIIGGFISASAAATAEITKLRLVFMDLQKETFQGLAATGFRLDTNLGKVIDTVLKANISIDQFNRLTLQNADGLRVFGGTIGNAAEKFTNNLTKLTSEESPVGMGLRLLGLGSNEIAEEFADFIQTNRNNAYLLGLEETELNKQLQDRIKSERVIAEMTGKSAQEQRQAQMQLATDAAFQAAVMAFPPEQRDVLSTFVAGLSGPVQDAAKQLLAFGTITDEQTALLSTAAPGLLTAIENEIEVIRSGSRDADRSIANILKVGSASIDSLEQLSKLGIIDPRFSGSLGEFFLQILRSEAQLENLNKAQDKFGRTFADQEELVGFINKEYKTQFDLAKQLAAEGKLTTEALTASGEIDAETARIIQQAAEVEDAVGAFQSKIFSTLSTNFEGLTDITVMLTDAFGDLLEAAGIKDPEVSLATKGYTATDTYASDKEGTVQGKSQRRYQIYEKDGQQFLFDRSQKEFIKQLYAGGFGFPGNLAMVGERGPELMRFGNTGEVINNRTTNDIMSAAAGVVDAMKTTAPEPTGPTAAPTTTEVQRVVNNMSEDLLKQMVEALNQSNMIQSTMLKETKKSKRFDY